jgi:hypothetical protein
MEMPEPSLLHYLDPMVNLGYALWRTVMPVNPLLTVVEMLTGVLFYVHLAR